MNETVFVELAVASVTVIVTVTPEPLTWVGVPVIRPLELIDRPAGRVRFGSLQV